MDRLPLSQNGKRQKIRIVCLASTAYTVAISAWFITWATIGDGNWWLAIINRIAPFLFLPIPILAIPLAISRHIKWGLPLFLPAVIFCVLYAPYLFPRFAPANSQPDLSILSFNALYRNTNYDAVSDIVLAYRPDFVTFQEMQPEMMTELEQRLAGIYPYSIMGDEHPYGTTAIFSRHPGKEAYVLGLTTDRPAVVFRTEVSGKEVTVISAHLLAYGLQWVKLADMPKAIMERTGAQNGQAKRILEEIQKQEGVIILGCDCNSKETSSSSRILAGQLSNAARVAGWSLNVPNIPNAKQDTNLHHIDYIFYRG
ncbi:MAG: endonuclease/exonuclease/phosphatase family protein [Chloroflexota bacterium]